MMDLLGGTELGFIALMLILGGMTGPGFVVKLMLLVAFGWSL